MIDRSNVGTVGVRKDSLPKIDICLHQGNYQSFKSEISTETETSH